MRILIVDTTLHGPLIGGAQTFLEGLLKGLVALKHEVHLVAADTPDHRILEAIKGTGAVLHTRLWKKNALAEEITPRFAAWVNELDPDIYLVSVSPDIGWTVLPSLNPRIATLTIGHTDSATFYSPAAHYYSFLTGAIGVSDEICEHFIEKCLIPADSVDWIPYGVKVNQGSPAEIKDGILRMIYVGRLENHQKRVMDLAKIAKGLSLRNVNYQLNIVGDGPEMSSLKEELTEEIMTGKVQLKGWLKGDEVIRSMREAEIFVLTSAYEGFCIALVESIANGCCPVVTNIRSGNKQLIENGKNGFLITIGDINEFVEKIQWLVSNPGDLYKMREAAWQTGTGYSIERMVKNYETCFEKTILRARTHLRSMNKAYPLMESCRSKYPNWLRKIKIFIKGVRA